MPLFTLPNSISQEDFEKLSETTLKALGIPDPEDKEWRIDRNEGGKRTITISFTTGDNEYPDTDSPAYRPTDETIRTAARTTLAKLKELDIKVGGVTMEIWPPNETTFDFLPFRIIPPKGQLPNDLRRELGQEIDSFEARLIVPQSFVSETIGVAPKEGEPPHENPLSSLLDGVFREIQDIGIPDNKGVRIMTVVPDAQTQISVEVDLKTNENIKSEVRQHLAGKIGELITLSHPEIESSTIWIRQGEVRRISIPQTN